MLRGLADPVADSQAIFRAVLEAMARPGRVAEIPPPHDVPPPLAAAAAAVCLALVDVETTLWLDPGARTAAVVEYLRFHCGVSLAASPEDADFALVSDVSAMPALDVFAQGSDEEPERSATVIIEVAALGAGNRVDLAGPGIAESVGLETVGVPSSLWSQLRDNRARFPRGVDLILVAGRRLAALPRTVSIEG